MKRATTVAIALGATIAIVAANALAFMHARAMTRFADNGSRTKRPEDLSILETARVLVGGVTIPRPDNTKTPAAAGLPFETHRFETASGATIEAWLIPAPAERPLVLAFHGYAASKSALIPIARAIHDLGYPILLVDFYGSGGSSGSGTTLGVLEARDVAAAVGYAARTWPQRRIVLYGFSMGGAAVLRSIAVEGVQPDGIMLEATFDTLLNTAKNRFRTMGLPATPFAELLLFWGGTEWGFDPFSHNPVDYGRLVTCPTLILHGWSDARVPPAQAERLQQAINNARLAMFAGVPHMLIVNARGDEWKARVGAFLAETLTR